MTNYVDFSLDDKEYTAAVKRYNPEPSVGYFTYQHEVVSIVDNEGNRFYPEEIDEINIRLTGENFDWQELFDKIDSKIKDSDTEAKIAMYEYEKDL